MTSMGKLKATSLSQCPARKSSFAITHLESLLHSIQRISSECPV